MTRPTSTATDPASGPIESDPLEGGQTPTYQGSRFPWWLAIFWLSFLVFGLAYLARLYLPDLRTWLVR